MGQFGLSTAANGPGTELKKATDKKRAKYRKMVAASLPESNRRARFEVLAFESSGYTSPIVKSLVKEWERAHT